MSHIYQLIDKWNNTFSGNPLYGESLMAKLSKIEVKKMEDFSSEILNKIAQQIQHIIYWKVFTIDKLEGNVRMNNQKDWMNVSIDSLEDWQKIIEELEDSQKNLIKALEGKTDDFLLQNIPSRKYSYLDLVEGIIQHDVYHTGQIGLFAKQFETK